MGKFLYLFLSIQAGRVLFRGGASSRRFFSSCGRLLGSSTIPLRFPAWRFDEGAAVGIGFGPAALRPLISCGRSLVEKIMPCRRFDRNEFEAGMRSVGSSEVGSLSRFEGVSSLLKEPQWGRLVNTSCR